MVDQPEPLEDRIRAAMTSGEFIKARKLWIELGDRLRRGAAERPVPATRLRQARELLAWCRTMAIVDYARCQQRLNQLAVSTRYADAPCAAPPRLLARL